MKLTEKTKNRLIAWSCVVGMLLVKSYRLFRYHDEVNYYFKDYGKTWALTKEELL